MSLQGSGDACEPPPLLLSGTFFRNRAAVGALLALNVNG
jgi:hypothetical protein